MSGKINNVMRCPNCKGMGQHQKFRVWHGRVTWYQSMVTCTFCEGEGQVSPDRYEQHSSVKNYRRNEAFQNGTIAQEEVSDESTTTGQGPAPAQGAGAA